MVGFSRDKFTFLHDGVIIGTSFAGAFGRNSVYAKDTTDKQKDELKAFLKEQLTFILQEYKKDDGIDERRLVELIIKMSDTTSSQFGSILNNGRFRIGTSQKLINLYLKFCWLILDISNAPPHCPIDSIIIQKLDKKFHHYRWTKLDSVKEYLHIIEGVESKAGNRKDMSTWELENYGANGK